ncbi:MAG: 23S rRNA (uracil(1939)-C(5))-methyltransferase RlmD [Elusimicrobia bacterium]|nr:23S rRNA (uracil(1939)-C(5))-methyltransferase RlmD [Elusimicrobiota bacterium]
MIQCQHFGVCGGCGWPGVPYEEQLERKMAAVTGVLAPFELGDLPPILPSPERWFYRNKMEFAFGTADGSLALGLRREGRFDQVVSLQECLVLSPDAPRLLETVRSWAEQEHIPPYDLRRHQGVLRYLIIREGKHTVQRMVHLIGTPELQTHVPSLRERLLPELPGVTTMLVGYTTRKSDVALAEHTELLSGPGWIEERLLTLQFRISPSAFFQTNTAGAELLYHTVAAWVPSRPGVLLDLYAGTGGMTLTLAGAADRVIGVESNAAAVQDAEQNAQLNGITNCEFVAEDVAVFLRRIALSQVLTQLSAVVVDPPRAGMHPKAMAALLELNPPCLVYVSCNPQALARDLQQLGVYYRITAVQPIDLFPHTPHVEVVLRLDHR